MTFRLWGVSLFYIVSFLLNISSSQVALPPDAPVMRFLAQHRDSLTAEITRQLEDAFAPTPEEQPEGNAKTGPSKCATLPVFLYQQLQQSGVAVPDDWSTVVDVQQTGAAFSIISPAGYFHLYYDVVGPNAVPTIDTLPANGVPDYVERAARYLDSAWVREFEELGFKAPPINPPTTRYEVYFKDMNVYGYTTTTSRSPYTYIVLENDFAGFPPNDDPEGNQLGALKVTIAHELKHASQYVTSYWSEGNWVELDATHMEDVVFDEVNDYYNYLLSANSPLMAPEIPLDDGGGGSYEDCIWHHYLAEKFGIGILKAFWQRREVYRAEAVLNSYEKALKQYQSSLTEAFREFTLWNFLTGTRAIPNVGYEEAARYPTSKIARYSSAFPVTSPVGVLPHLSAYFLQTSVDVSEHFSLVYRVSTSSPVQMTTLLKTDTGEIFQQRTAVDTSSSLYPWDTPVQGEIQGVLVTNASATEDATVQEALLTPPIVITPVLFADTKQDTGTYALQAQVTAYLAPLRERGVQLVFATDAAQWDSVAAVYDSVNALFQATIPAQPYGSSVAYYWQAEDSMGTVTRFPYAAPDSLLHFQVMPDTVAPEITVIALQDPALSDVPLRFRARIQDHLSDVDSAWVEIEGGPQLPLQLNGTEYQVQWAADTAAYQAGDSVQYRVVARDTEGNRGASPWFQFYWTEWLHKIRTSRQRIPDDVPAGLRDSIRITAAEIPFENPVIVDVQLSLQANHTWIGDLTIALTAPDGHTIRLMDHPGGGQYGSGANGPNVVFTDTASVSIHTIDLPSDSTLSGVFRPYPDHLQTFQRLSPVGDWVLTVRDDSPGDSGSVLHWGISVKIRPYRGVLTAIRTPGNPPKTFELFPNFPNPFNGHTIIRFRLPNPQVVDAAIFNLLGERIRTLFHRRKFAPGTYRLMWNGQTDAGLPAPTGVYFIRVATPDQQVVQKMVLLR